MNTTVYQIREATREDIPALILIRNAVKENALVTRTIEAPEYETAFFEHGKAWVCEINAELVGFSCARKKQKDIWALFLKKEWEGKGIGNRLMEAAESWMFSEGVKEIDLSTDVGTRAERLYTKRGWRRQETNEKGEVFLKLSR